MIKSLKEDKDFKDRNIQLFFDCIKKFELLEQIDSDMGMLESASNFFFSSVSQDE
jgi:magnesium transporter